MRQIRPVAVIGALMLIAYGPAEAQTCQKCDIDFKCVNIVGPHAGYRVCVEMGPTWCEVSQPCGFYSSSRSGLMLHVPFGMLFGNNVRLAGNQPCRERYMAYPLAVPESPLIPERPLFTLRGEVARQKTRFADSRSARVHPVG